MIQGLITGFLIIVFLAGCAWAFSRKRQPTFDAAARLPLDDEPAAVVRPSTEHR